MKNFVTVSHGDSIKEFIYYTQNQKDKWKSTRNILETIKLISFANLKLKRI